jgi:heptaprenylglyceryl phosphate synthase
MSQANIEKLYQKSINDQMLRTRILQGTTSHDDVIKNALKEANNVGCKFTYEEASSWLNNHEEIKPVSELSNDQLEKIVGGKS